jgi:hypothetical protein
MSIECGGEDSVDLICAGERVMAKGKRVSPPVPADAVINSLRIQGVFFDGPFCTPGERIVFVVENYLFLESELVDLLEQNKLDRDGIQELAKRLGAANARSYPPRTQS